MRNYFKFRAVEAFGDSVFFPPIHSRFHCYANDDAALFVQVRARQQQLIQFNNPLRDWTFTNNVPIDYYWKLNQANFLKMLQFSPDFFWDNFLGADGNYTASNVPDIVTANVSPRATFPTTSGTDGQRLRRGQTAKDGFALNYLGKLYFLTNNTVFRDLFELLKDGKVSAKEALAKAEAIVEARG